MPYVTADTSLPRTLDVTISLARAQAETRTDLSTPCVACEDLGFFPDENRVRFYSTIEAVEDDFAAGTEAHFAATAFFEQSPRPAQMAIGEVFSDAQPAMIYAPELSSTELAAIIAVSDGTMDIDYDEGSAPGTENLTGMNFTSCTDIDDIADVINDALGSGSDLEAVVVTLPGGEEHLTIQTTATGDDVTIEYPDDPGSGTFMGALLGLTSAGSGTICDGYTPTGIADELTSIKNAAAAIDEYIYGWCLGASLRVAATQEAAAVWAASRTAIIALVNNSSDALNAADSTDMGSVIFATNNKRAILLYHDNSQAYPDMSILAYMLSVNYQLKDSTVTAKFKELPGIDVVEVTETEWSTLQSKGYNTYVAVGNDAETYRDGNTAYDGWWMDSVINLDNFLEDLSVNVFNVFLRNGKVPYTRRGQMLLVDACKDTGEQYVYNGTFADREETDTTKKAGFSITSAVQVIPTAISAMTAAQRAARTGPPIQMIVQEAGAIHSVAISVEVVQ